jgi:hypothetical protein
MENILIVESRNDEFFIAAFIQHLNIKNVGVTYACCINDYDCMGGLNPDKLKEALAGKERDIKFGKISKLGILIDQDDKTDQERFELINTCLSKAYPVTNPLIDAKSKLFDIQVNNLDSVKIAVYFTNVGGSGELETILKTIKKIDSPYADCLNAWRACLEHKNEQLTNKEFDKVWTSFYMRYDACTNKEKKQAGTKCNNEASMKKPIWNFDHPCLDGLRDFLLLFSK